MEIIEKEENIEKVYELVYDKEKVDELLKKIARDCSFRRSGEYSTYENGFIIEANNLTAALEEIEHSYNSAGHKLYENVDENSVRLSKYDCWEHGFPYHVSFKATKVELPRLYFYISKILNEDIEGYKSLNNYPNVTNEYISYDEKERKLERWAINIINSGGGTSIDTVALDHLVRGIDKVREERKDNPNYNFDLLKQYYIEALNLFSLKLKRKTEYFVDGEVKEMSSIKI